MKLSYFLLSILMVAILTVDHGFAQDSVLLINGKYKLVKVKELTEEEVIYEIETKRYIKTKTFNKHDVYSINYYDGGLDTIYKQNIEIGFDFDKRQMGLAIKGQQDGEMFYKAPWITVGGAAVGGAAPFIVPPAYGLFFVPAYAAAIDLHAPKPDPKHLEVPEWATDEYYLSGYERAASRKRVRNALLGGLSGFAVSVVIYSLIAN